MTEMAVSVAAEATAQYQRSLVHVEVDNEREPGVSTFVTVRAPDRPYLLGDMTGALLGLGLAVRQAACSKVEGMSSTASLQFSLQYGGRAITDIEKLRAIEQRLQQRFCGRQGLNGGVRRLVVERFLRAEPPWQHERLDPLAPPAEREELWLASLCVALGPSGGSKLFAAATTALAARLAAEILPEMTRMRLPKGATLSHDQTRGEWLLLVEEGPALVMTGAPSPSLSRRNSDGSFGSPTIGRRGLSGLGGSDRHLLNSRSPASLRPPRPRLVGLRSTTDPNLLASVGTPATERLDGEASSASGGEVGQPTPSGSMRLSPGSVLFDTITRAAASEPSGLDGGGVDGSSLPSPPTMGWTAFKVADGGDGDSEAAGGGVIVRCCHLNLLQQRFVTLREQFAREHAQILADNPLFAPMNTTELLALCRRATVVEVPPLRLLLPVATAREQPRSTTDPALRELHEIVQDRTFGIVLRGGLHVGLTTGVEGGGGLGGGDGGQPLSSPRATSPQKQLPATLPLAHLKETETFGVWGSLGGALAPGIKMGSSTDGATLLCWPKDKIMDVELRKLSLLEGGTSLLERCWIARSPLSLCLGNAAFEHSNNSVKNGSRPGEAGAAAGANGSSAHGGSNGGDGGVVNGGDAEKKKKPLWNRVGSWRKATNSLLKVLEPLSLEEAIRRESAGELAHPERLLVLVTSGEVLRRASGNTTVDVRRRSVVSSLGGDGDDNDADGGSGAGGGGGGLKSRVPPSAAAPPVAAPRSARSWVACDGRAPPWAAVARRSRRRRTWRWRCQPRCQRPATRSRSSRTVSPTSAWFWWTRAATRRTGRW